MSQLLPVVVVAPNGSREVIDDLNGEILANNNNNNDLIDELIARMQNNEDNNNNNNPNSDNNNNSLAISLSNNQPSAQTINRVNQSEEHEGQPINMCVWARRDLIRQYDQNTLRLVCVIAVCYNAFRVKTFKCTMAQTLECSGKIIK